MPSLYEGISLSMAEAQGTGLPVFAANTIAEESFATSFAIKLPLNTEPKNWANAIIHSIASLPANREMGEQQMRDHGFDAKECTRIIETIYNS